MTSRKLLFTLIVAICSIKLAGCRGEAAPPKPLARPQTSPNPAYQDKAAGQTSFASNHARPLHREAPHSDTLREAFLSTYNNPEQGISFRYPRNYSLEEGEVLERSFFLKRQEDLDIEQPGATLVATLLIPEDGYPNTTFAHGSLQLVTDEFVNEKGCLNALLAGSNVNGSGTTTVQETPFLWNQQASVTGGAKLLERAYAGYAQGTCYQFLLTVAAEETPDPDDFKKPADTAKIMKQLEKIVSSTKIFSRSAPTPLSETGEETADRL